MVPYFTIVALLTTAVVCFMFPVIVTFFIRKKQRGYIGPIIAGALAFFLFQMVIRIPIITSVLPSFGWYNESNEIVVMIVLALTAALFETFGRWFTMKFLLKDRLSYYTGILHGVGHGAIEALLLVAINFVIYALFALQLNQGGLDAFMEQFAGSTSEVIESMKNLADIIMNESSWTFLLSGYERVMTMIIHIGLSLLMMQGLVTKKVMKFSLITIGLHFLLDFGVQILPYYGVDIILVEGFVTLFAIGLIVYIFKIRFVFKGQVEAKIENQDYIDSEY